MTEAKKTAASKKAADSGPSDVKDSGPGSDIKADSGPGTGSSTPAEQPRTAADTVVNDPESGPIVAPDHALQEQPAEGYTLSSTDHTYAAVGGNTVAGETFDALVDEQGKKVSAGSLFEDDGKSYVIAKKRVFEQFYYPNTTEVAKRLLFVEGQRVNRAQAEKVKATL